jgi:hypothetical protein
MRQVLDLIGPEWSTMTELAGSDARSAVEATRRACKRLAADGLVELDYRQLKGELGLDHYEGRQFWSEIIAKRGYEPDAQPAHPYWALVARRAPQPSVDGGAA